MKDCQDTCPADAQDKCNQGRDCTYRRGLMSPLKHTIRPLAILATVAINAYFAFRGPQLALVSYTAMVVMIVLFLLCCYMEYCIYKDQKFIAQANLTVVEAQRVLAETLERTELERLVREVTRNN